MPTGTLTPPAVITTERRAYTVEDAIGTGGFADLYRVSFRDSQGVPCFAVLKVLQSKHASDSHLRDLFFNEIESIRRTQGTYVVRYLDRGTLPRERGGLPFFVMEHMAGGTLYDLVSQEGLLDELRAVHFGRSIAAALKNAHRMHTVYDPDLQDTDGGSTQDLAVIIHRDVTPTNILLDQTREHAKLSDFGSAIQARDGSAALNDRIRTPEFASPEQRDGSSKITTASDIYQLGGVIYWALTRVEPVQLLTKPLGEREWSHSRALKDLLSSMLALNPGERPSAEAVESKLEEIALFAKGSNVPVAIPPLLGPSFSMPRFRLALAVWFIVIAIATYPIVSVLSPLAIQAIESLTELVQNRVPSVSKPQN